MKLEKEVAIENEDIFIQDLEYGSDFEDIRISGFVSFTQDEAKKIVSKNRYIKLKLTLEVKEPILDEVERKYLSGVIRPFRDRINYIIKLGETPNEFILIDLIDDLPIQFPYFEKNKMYNGMKLNKKYKLEDLKI